MFQLKMQEEKNGRLHEDPALTSEIHMRKDEYCGRDIGENVYERGNASDRLQRESMFHPAGEVMESS